MDWKRWFEGTSAEDIPNLDERRVADDEAERRRTGQSAVSDEDEDFDDPPQVKKDQTKEREDNSPAAEAESQSDTAEEKEEPSLRADMMPRKAPAPKRDNRRAASEEEHRRKREEYSEDDSEEYPEDDPRDYDDGYEEEYDDEYDDLPEDEEEPLPPMEAKKLKGRIKKIVRRFRIRSFGMICLGLCGLGVCAVLGILLHRLMIGLIVGVLCLALAVLFEFMSWMGVAGDVNEELFTKELKHRYRKIVFRVGVRCMRVLGVILAWEAALLYIDRGLGIAFTWKRWAIYGALFSILVLLFFFYLHPMVQGLAHWRGIDPLSEEEKERRKDRRLFLTLGRIVGILLIVGVAVLQVWFNQNSWKKYTEGKSFDTIESFTAYLENEVIPDTTGAEEIWLSERTYEDVYTIVDGDGNVLQRVNHRNQKVTAFDTVLDDAGRDPVAFIAYSSENEAAGRWKKELFNLGFFAVYPIITMVCGLFSGRANQRKMDRRRANPDPSARRRKKEDPDDIDEYELYEED